MFSIRYSNNQPCNNDPIQIVIGLFLLLDDYINVPTISQFIENSIIISFSISLNFLI